MRVLLVLIATTACSTTASPVPDVPPISIRDRLSHDDPRLVVLPDASAGTISAQRRLATGWDSAVVDLHLTRGELVLTGGDQLAIDGLSVDLAPIAIPDTVLGHRADILVRVAQRRPTALTTTWTDDNTARGTGTMELVLHWDLVTENGTLGLGSPDLPAIPVTLAISGNGGRVNAELRTLALGELWRWADLIALDDLSLVVTLRDAEDLVELQ